MTDRSVLGQLTSFLPGFRPVEGGQLKEMANFLFSTQTGIVASTTSSQVGATPLGAAINIVQTSTGSGTDAVRLMPAIIGAEQWVENRTANTIKVFANGTDRIIPSNSPTPNASSAGVSVESGELAEFQCGTSGIYKQGNLPGGVAAAPGILVESGSAVKISGMSAASSLSGNELVDVVQGGVNKRSTAQGIANLAASTPAVLVESGSAVKISAMSAASTLAGTELVDIVQGGANKKTTTQDIADLGGGAGLLLSSSTHLLSADILALNTSPFELAPAPGLNKEIIVVAWGANLIFVANSYTTGTVTAWYGDYNNGIDVFTLGNLIAQGANQSRRGSGTIGSASTDSFELANIVNQPIMLAPVFSDPTGGDGTLKVTVYYIIRDLSL